MKIAILSDLHDNYADWGLINRILKEEKITELVFCGDLCAPSMLKKMVEEFQGRIKIVYGNVADRELEKKIADESKNIRHCGDEGKFELEGKKIALVHFPDEAQKLASSGQYDYVFFGHNHTASRTKIGRTLLLNPGTAGGMFQYPSFAILDLATGEVAIKQITL